MLTLGLVSIDAAPFTLFHLVGAHSVFAIIDSIVNLPCLAIWLARHLLIISPDVIFAWLFSFRICIGD